MLIAEALEEQAARGPDGVALVAGERTVSFGELAGQVRRLAAGLARSGLAPGERLAVLLPNSIELVTTMLGASAAGLIVVPLVPKYAPEYMAQLVARTTPAALVASRELSARLPREASGSVRLSIPVGGAEPGQLAYEELVASPAAGLRPLGVDPDPICLLADSSGSSGPVKIVAHAQAGLVVRADRFVETMDLTAADEPLVALHLGRPVNLVCLLLAAIRAGAPTSLLESPDPESFWKAYRRRRPAYLFVPAPVTKSYFAHPAAEGADHARLRFWITGGDVASDAIRRRVAQATGQPLREMYGLTEGGALAITPPGRPVKVGSVGTPIRGVELRLVDPQGREVGPGQVGALRARSEGLMVGYWNDPLATSRALGSGWLETEDFLRRDGDGTFWFEGRVADLVFRASGPWLPTPVVRALLELPGVEEALVLGLGDPPAGQVPVAFYRLGPSVPEPGADALRAWVAERAGADAVPFEFHRVERWPLTHHGKFDRVALLALAGERARASRG